LTFATPACILPLVFFQESLPPRTDVLNALEWLLPSCEQVVRNALQQFLAEYSGSRRIFRHSTEPSIINDLMWQGALDKLQVTNRVRFACINQLDLIVADDRYGIRFKMLRSDRRTENIDTVQQSLFDSQQLSVPELPAPLVTLNVGYVPEEIELLRSRIYLTKPRAGGAVDWWHELGVSNVQELPLTRREPERRPVRPRTDKAAETAQE
jgi:hypothetical protein